VNVNVDLVVDVDLVLDANVVALVCVDVQAHDSVSDYV
jgi:hypothetical protein